MTDTLAGRHPVYSCLAPPHYFGWHERRQAFKPETSRLRLSVAELPWLDYLVRLAYPARNNAYRVLNRNPFNWCGHQRPHKFQGFRLFGQLALEPARPTHRQVGARRVKNGDVPTAIKHGQDIALKVIWGIVFGRQNIT